LSPMLRSKISACATGAATETRRAARRRFMEVLEWGSLRKGL
jgi:hypothetical protein